MLFSEILDLIYRVQAARQAFNPPPNTAATMRELVETLMIEVVREVGGDVGTGNFFAISKNKHFVNREVIEAYERLNQWLAATDFAAKHGVTASNELTFEEYRATF